MYMGTPVIGLTGAFGSGCSTGARHLRDERGFKLLRLSDIIRAKWKETRGVGVEPSRSDLQRLGDQLRQEGNPGVLASLALAPLTPEELGELLVIDGIRNVGEVERLQEVYGYRFTLIAILSSSEARWGRIGSTAYLGQGLSELDFHQDDTRDRNEETPWGQQVELCIDKADIIIDNSDDVTLRDFKAKVLEFADLVTGRQLRPAEEHEILMHMAYGASHGTKCLKRHVGAVLVDQVGDVVGAGYNENPRTTHPCAEEPEYGYRCYRDIVRNNHFKMLSTRGFRCPQCGEPLPPLEGPPWLCPSCMQKGQKTNLEAFFFPDRAMNWCTAIHAEVWALLAAGDRARGATVFTTTFPCMQCAEKIAQAGVQKVWFTEAYPDNHSLHRLNLAGIDVQRFEGVRSAAFERIFSQVKPR